MDVNKIYNKLEEYKSLLNFDDDYMKKDYKNNLKFIKWAVNRMIKNKDAEESIMQFIQDTIDIHNKATKTMLLQP